jgi:hypothetical protein
METIHRIRRSMHRSRDPGVLHVSAFLIDLDSVPIPARDHH